MKVALVYDRVNKWGGAERVLLALHALFPDAPLYTSVYDKKNTPWADEFKINTSFLQNLPFASTHHELLAPLMPLAFERFNFDKYDLVISLTSEAAKGIITKPGTVHICYCLTPTRYLWSGYDEYFKNKNLSFFSKPVTNVLRKWDLIASKRPDMFVAISKEVQKRIKKYYGRESDLVYPPVTFYSSSEQSESRSDSGQARNKSSRLRSNNNDYFLVVSRLSKFTKYKRVDLAINACNELGLPLKIVGDGSLKKELEKIAGTTIEFLGNIGDEELAKYYKNCKALIFPGFEDLGLVMIEAQMFGKPVIAFKNGGALEIVIDNKTGLFFDKQTPESLSDALKIFKNQKFDPVACRNNAEQFEFEKFRMNFLSVVNKLI